MNRSERVLILLSCLLLLGIIGYTYRDSQKKTEHLESVSVSFAIDEKGKTFKDTESINKIIDILNVEKWKKIKFRYESAPSTFISFHATEGRGYIGIIDMDDSNVVFLLDIQGNHRKIGYYELKNERYDNVIKKLEEVVNLSD